MASHDENAQAATNGFINSQPLFAMAPKPDTALLDIHQQPPPARDALVDVTLTSSNPATAANTKPLQKKALERGEKAYRAWKQRQAERAGARPAPQAAAPALAGPPAPPASAPYHAPPHSAPGARLPAPLPSQPSVTEICVEVGSAPSSPRRPMGPAAALANATAAAMPIATELFSRLGQLACPPPPTHHRQHEEAPLVDDANTLGDMPSHNALPHTQQQESWHWSMRLPIWPFTFTLGVALADEDAEVPTTTSYPPSPTMEMLMPTADNINLAWQPSIPAVSPPPPPALATSSNPLFEHSTTPVASDVPLVAQENVHEDGHKTTNIEGSVQPSSTELDAHGVLLHVEAAQSNTPIAGRLQVEGPLQVQGTLQEDTETTAAATVGTPTDPAQRMQGVDPDLAQLTAGPTKQQQRAFQDAHGHAPHGWRLNEDTLRWEPVMLTDALAPKELEQLHMTDVVAERNRLKKQLQELQAKVAALEAAKGDPPSPTDPMHPGTTVVSQAAAAKIALANVLVGEPKLSRANLVPAAAAGVHANVHVQPTQQHTDVHATQDQEQLSGAGNTLQPATIPPSPALSTGGLSSIAASPLGVVVPEDAPTAPQSAVGKGGGPAKKLSFFENSLFSQPLAMLLGTGAEEDALPSTEEATGEISCATTPLGIDAAAAQWQEAQAASNTGAHAATEHGVGSNQESVGATECSVDLGAALRHVGGAAEPEDDWDEDWGLDTGKTLETGA